MKKMRVLLLVALVAAGCSDDSTAPPPPGETITRQIDDLNYVRGTYFLIQPPGETLATGATIDISTLMVFVDDINGSNDQGVRAGYGELDPTADPSATPRVLGNFDELQPLADYEVTTFPYGDRFPVLILKHAIHPFQMLAVAYEEDVPGSGRRAIGSVPACTGAGCDSVRLKLLQAPKNQYVAKSGNPDEYEADYTIAPINAVREQELRNVYDLLFRNVAPEDLSIQVHRYGALSREPSDRVIDNGHAVSYLQILGIDLFADDGTGLPLVGADGNVDRFTNATFLDTERGILFFPDLRPFDPRIATRPDATPADNEFHKPRIAGVDTSIPGLRKLVLWPSGAPNPPGSASGVTPIALRSNPNVYDKLNLQFATDRHYYLKVVGPASAAP